MAMASIVSKLARAALASPSAARPAAAAIPTAVARAALATRASPSADSPAAAAIPTAVSPAGGLKYAHILGDRIQIHPDENVFKSKEAMWAFYKKWCKYHAIFRDSYEMERRFKTFSEMARLVYDSGGLMYMSHYSDLNSEELRRLHPKRVAPHLQRRRDRERKRKLLSHACDVGDAPGHPGSQST